MFPRVTNNDCAKAIEAFLTVIDTKNVMMCDRENNHYAMEILTRKWGPEKTRFFNSLDCGLRTLGGDYLEASIGLSGKMPLLFEENMLAVLDQKCLICGQASYVCEYGIVAHVKCVKPFEVSVTERSTGLPRSVFPLFRKLKYRTTGRYRYCFKDGVPGVMPSIYSLAGNVEDNMMLVQAHVQTIAERKRELKLQRNKDLKLFSAKRKAMVQEVSEAFQMSPSEWKLTVPQQFERNICQWESGAACKSALSMIQGEEEKIRCQAFNVIGTYQSNTPLKFEYVPVLLEFLRARQTVFEMGDMERLHALIREFKAFQSEHGFEMFCASWRYTCGFAAM